MGYPPQGPYGQPPQQGPPQQGPQYQQGPPPQGYDPNQQQWQQPQQGQGYAPFQGGQPMGGSGGSYDWGTMYGMADHSVGQLIDPGQYTAIVKSASWDRTKDGSKSAWTIVFILTSGPKPGMKLTMTMAVSPKKNNGEDNEAGMGILFRQLAAMGIPVPPPYGQQGWWQMGWNEQQVGQAMTGKPVLLQVVHNEYDGVTNNKIRDILPPPPGAPTQAPQLTQQQAPAPYGGPPQQGPPQYQQGPPQGQGYPPQQGPPQQGPPPGQAPQPWQQQGPPANYQQPPQGYNPAVPPHAQQPNPGAPGVQQFTQQGQAWQPSVNPQQEQQATQTMGQQPWINPNGMPQQQQQQPPQGEQGPPQAPNWAGGQPQ
jgi:hypothetical protein